jgi:hypothetical protein
MDEVPEADHVFMLAPTVTGALGMTLIRVHPELACAGIDYCSIHRPSDHHMATWPQVWRPLLGIVTRLCEHDQQHPDPDDLHARRFAGRCDCHCSCCKQIIEGEVLAVPSG